MLAVRTPEQVANFFIFANFDSIATHRPHSVSLQRDGDVLVVRAHLQFAGLRAARNFRERSFFENVSGLSGLLFSRVRGETRRGQAKNQSHSLTGESTDIETNTFHGRYTKEMVLPSVLSSNLFSRTLQFTWLQLKR